MHFQISVPGYSDTSDFLAQTLRNAGLALPGSQRVSPFMPSVPAKVFRLSVERLQSREGGCGTLFGGFILRNVGLLALTSSSLEEINLIAKDFRPDGPCH